MNLDKKGTVRLLLIIFASILFFAAVMHLNVVLSTLGTVFNVMTPLFIGLSLAFIFNMPLKFFECVVFKKLTYSKSKTWKKIKRPLCLTLSLLLVLAFVGALLVIIIPQLVNAVENFFGKLPEYMNTLDDLLDDLIVKLNIPLENIEFDINWDAVSEKVLEFFRDQEQVSSITFDVITGLSSGIFNGIFGFIFAIYILASKESLGRWGRRVVFSVFSSDRAKSVMKIISMSNKAFNGFLSGQFIEALTIGLLCFIGMIIFGMPYPVLISVIISVTALVPIFGPIFGTIIGAFIILLESPIKALWFVVFILILQQIESNVIYPKIMSKSVSLPGIWVLFAVTTFGGLWGVFGIVLSIPLCSVAYALFDSWMSKRLIERNISTQCYDVDHSKMVYDYGLFKFAKRKKDAEDKAAQEKFDSDEIKDSANENTDKKKSEENK